MNIRNMLAFIVGIFLIAPSMYAKDLPYKLLVTSIPKSGTFMISKLVDGLTGLSGQGSSSSLTKENVDLKPGQYLLSHAPALPQMRAYKRK